MGSRGKWSAAGRRGSLRTLAQTSTHVRDAERLEVLVTGAGRVPLVEGGQALAVRKHLEQRMQARALGPRRERLHLQGGSGRGRGGGRRGEKRPRCAPNAGLGSRARAAAAAPLALGKASERRLYEASSARASPRRPRTALRPPRQGGGGPRLTSAQFDMCPHHWRSARPRGRARRRVPARGAQHTASVRKRARAGTCSPRREALSLSHSLERTHASALSHAALTARRRGTSNFCAPAGALM